MPQVLHGVDGKGESRPLRVDRGGHLSLDLKTLVVVAVLNLLTSLATLGVIAAILLSG